MDIIISNTSGEPIYKQLVDQIKDMILKGTLKEGDALPSMRYLAAQLRISLITTKRAYVELENLGLIESYTGKGSFVKSKNMNLIREEHLKILEKNISAACSEAKICGVSLEDLTELLTLMYTEEDNL